MEGLCDMGISRFYTQVFEVYTKEKTSTSSGVQEQETLVATVKGIIDKATTAYGFSGDRENFFFTNVLFTAPNSAIVEDTIVKHDGKVYDVVSVIDPLYRRHHLEVLLNRRG